MNYVENNLLKDKITNWNYLDEWFVKTKSGNTINFIRGGISGLC